MKYLVTGGAGFIGSNLVDELIRLGNDVVVIDNLSTGKKENINPKATFHNADVADFEAIKPLFSGVDYVFHLAALPRVLLSMQEPVKTSKTNLMGTISVFKAAAESKAKRVIFYSSSAVYGNQKKIPFKESMEPSPVSPYGLQKLVGEQFAKLFSDIYHIPIISLRFFNVYGPRIDFDSDYGLVIGKFLYASINNQPLTIFGDGNQTRGFCYVGDVVDASIKAMESSNLKGGEVINISSKESYAVNDLAKLIGGNITYMPKREGDPLDTKADVSMAKKLLQWESQINLNEGLKKTKEWLNDFLKNKN